MCGICGILNHDKSRRVNPEILRTMNDTMAHRGPDDSGICIKDACGIAMRRLSIIDLAGGHQPLSNENKDVHVVCNGEIYNFLELKEEMESKGHVFKTHSDVEVLPHLYEEYGPSFIDKLNGMFGFAIYDERNKSLLLARDRMGKKPLYYTVQKNSLIFGSELKAILKHPDVEREIDEVSLSKYLAYEYVPAPRSIFKGIKKLEAGHYLIYENGKIRTGKYWDVPQDEFSNIKIEDAAENLRELIMSAVKRRLISDVPLGVFLSGGIDSSAVTYMMTKLMPPKEVKTFSIAFAEKSFDESSYARMIADKLGTDHYEETCTPDSLLSLLPEVQNFLDEPLGDSSIIPTYALSKFTRRHVTVALGGDGGDELFAGYPTFQAAKYAKIYRKVPSIFRKNLIEPIGARLPVDDSNISFDFKVKQFMKGANAEDETSHFIWLGSFSPDEQKTLLQKPITGNIFDDVDRYLERCKNASEGNRALYLYEKLYLNEDILVKVDRASMGCSLEVRAPLLDRHIVEFASRLPYEMKLNKMKMKYVLKRALDGLIPSEIINRPKKGFGIPVAKWIKGPLKDMTSDLLSRERIKKGGFFEPEAVSKLLSDHLSGRVDNRKKLWTLIAFELWRDRWGKKTTA